MNSWVFLTVMVTMSFLTGYILSQDTISNQYHDYIYTKLSGYDDLQSDTYTALDTAAHAAGEYNMDTTTGDSLPVTKNIFTMLDYGFNPFSFPRATNEYEGFILTAFGIFKTLMWGYTAFLLFMIFKNKKNT